MGERVHNEQLNLLSGPPLIQDVSEDPVGDDHHVNAMINSDERNEKDH